jgi:hypothetical protein
MIEERHLGSPGCAPGWLAGIRAKRVPAFEPVDFQGFSNRVVSDMSDSGRRSMSET